MVKLIPHVFALSFAIATVGLVAGAARSQSFRDRGFIMPSKNIYCLVEFDPPDSQLRCEIVSGLKPLPPRPTKQPCELDWGSGVVLPNRGKTSVLCAGDTIRAAYPTLNYGRTWKRAGFTCTATTKGLTCTNASRNGFFLSRDRWKRF